MSPRRDGKRALKRGRFDDSANILPALELLGSKKDFAKCNQYFSSLQSEPGNGALLKAREYQLDNLAWNLNAAYKERLQDHNLGNHMDIHKQKRTLLTYDKHDRNTRFSPLEESHLVSPL